VAVFVELSTDAFAQSFKTMAQKGRLEHAHAGVPSVRRPLRGVEVKENTHAIMRVIRSDGSELHLFDSSDASGKSAQYANFILQTVAEQRVEKTQIIETFGESYIFFFGEKPRFLQVQALLLNSMDFNWEAEFWENYNQYLRGTKLAEMGARLYMFYEDIIVEGYMMQAEAQKTAMQQSQVQLSFTLFLTNYSNISFIGDPNYPIRADVNLPPGIDLTAADGYDKLFALSHRPPSATELGQIWPDENGFGTTQMLSDAIRQNMTSATFPGQDTQAFIRNASYAMYGDAYPPPTIQRSLPLRSLISDNYDEWTGPHVGGPPGSIPPVDADDRFVYSMTQLLKEYGVAADNPIEQQKVLGGGGGGGVATNSNVPMSDRVQVCADAKAQWVAINEEIVRARNGREEARVYINDPQGEAESDAEYQQRIEYWTVRFNGSAAAVEAAQEKMRPVEEFLRIGGCDQLDQIDNVVNP